MDNFKNYRTLFLIHQAKLIQLQVIYAALWSGEIKITGVSKYHVPSGEGVKTKKTRMHFHDTFYGQIQTPRETAVRSTWPGVIERSRTCIFSSREVQRGITPHFP